jgi:hypothetical protein
VDAAASGAWGESQGGLSIEGRPVSVSPARRRTALLSAFAYASADVHMPPRSLGDERVAYGKAVWSWHPLLVSSRRRCSEPNRALAKP